MQRIMCRAKIHGAVVTQTELQYEGSITIDRDLLEAADILPSERVQVVNLSNGKRFETYVIAAPSGSGIICLNGPAARLGAVGDPIHILSYVLVDDEVARKNFKMKTTVIGPGNVVQAVK